MTSRLYGALVASLGLALVLATNEASAAPRGVASAHPMFRPLNAHAFRHHRGRNFLFWPGIDGTYYGPDGTPQAEAYALPPTSSDVHYTYTYDVPWDWAHRFPPNVVPSDRPYVSSCTAEIVTVPGHDGGRQTVNVTRCY
ncbi:MAG TPA: hypothetical protein VKR55_17505 [Bradyrhizobium sp.]|uniref:hypothetical protein n=1 Tax=Bradyrhizobium sp. TaxID=376 RepID=UPI002B9DF430|nr:hypothetical protein [Bradyrhizobium sp.]HLZ03926.1 hypothetical protein [Bradyrhizobium sp.]